MDRKDELILQQLETIRTMAENSLNRMGTDFWGTPKETPAAPKEEEKKEAQNAPAKTKGAETSEEEQKEPEKIEDLKAELDSYIGLEAVKQEVKNLINMVTVHQMREKNGLPNTDLSLHMVFSGNPGTGKTTVAKMVGKIFKSLGLLSKGEVIVTERTRLVGRYIGETECNMQHLLEL